MSWNFRIIGHPDCLELAEVYYDDEGRPNGWCQTCTVADDAEGIRWLLDRWTEALGKPVIPVGELGGGIPAFDPDLRRLARLVVAQRAEVKERLAGMTPEERERFHREWAERLAADVASLADKQEETRG